MKVKYLGKDDPLELRHGKVYDVIGMDVDTGWYRIVDETYDDYLFPPEDFELLDNVTSSEVLSYLMMKSDQERIEYTDKSGIKHIGYVYVAESRDNNDGKASLCFMGSTGEMLIVNESDIAEIILLEHIVMREAFRQLSREAIEFLCKEFKLSQNSFFTMTENDFDDLYDKLCDIEHAETPSDDSPLTERGKMVESIITIVGNYFSQKLGYNDEEEFLQCLSEEDEE